LRRPRTLRQPIHRPTVLPSLHKPLPELSAGRVLRRSHRSVTNGDGPTQAPGKVLIRHPQLVLQSLAAFGVAALLSACANSGSSSVPSGVAGAPLSGIRAGAVPKKGSGAWDIAVYDYAYVPGLPEKLVCTESPSGSCSPVKKKDLKSSGSLSDSTGSASFKTTIQLGSLVGSAKAGLGIPGPSAGASDELASADTFTITSSTLPYGTPVSFKATIDVTPAAVHCKTAALINFAASTTYSGLSDQELCSSSPPPVLTATVNTSVGAMFTDQVAANLYLDVGNFSVGGTIGGAFKVTYHLDPITSGASYVTASGKQYP
jgi:hypothetical protein